MTKDEALKAVKEIKRISDDDETAHIREDELYTEFVEFIAAQGGDVGEIAKVVLSTHKIRFSRWCA